jgi:hypothetical protein
MQMASGQAAHTGVFARAATTPGILCAPELACEFLTQDASSALWDAGQEERGEIDMLEDALSGGSAQ